MGSIAAVGAAFGYTNSVLAYDDTLKTRPTSTTPVVPASTPTTTSTTTAAGTAAALAAATTAQKVELGNLAWDSDIATALFASSAPDATTGAAFFTGATLVGLLSTQNAAALAYLTPQATAPAGTIINAGA
jgi:hypothetical protein